MGQDRSADQAPSRSTETGRRSAGDPRTGWPAAASSDNSRRPFAAGRLTRSLRPSAWRGSSPRCTSARSSALLHVGPQRRVLNETPRLVHDAELQRRHSRRVLNASDDAMEDVEQERFEKGRIRAHGLEIEHLKPFDSQRVLEVVEQGRVAPTLNPLVQARRQRTGQRFATVNSLRWRSSSM